jgi:hypothetical protein
MSSDDLTTYVDIKGDLRRVSSVVEDHPSPILAPPVVAEWLSRFCAQKNIELRNIQSPTQNVQPRSISSSSSSCSHSNIPSTPSVPHSTPLVQQNVKLNRKTTLSVLYTYEDPNFTLEYPETSFSGVGYLMRRDLSNWRNPLSDLAYSQGKPSGQTKKGEAETCLILTDPSEPPENALIPCVKSHSTCKFPSIPLLL